MPAGTIAASPGPDGPASASACPNADDDTRQAASTTVDGVVVLAEAGTVEVVAGPGAEVAIG